MTKNIGFFIDVAKKYHAVDKSHILVAVCQSTFLIHHPCFVSYVRNDMWALPQLQQCSL